MKKMIRKPSATMEKGKKQAIKGRKSPQTAGKNQKVQTQKYRVLFYKSAQMQKSQNIKGRGVLKTVTFILKFEKIFSHLKIKKCKSEIMANPCIVLKNTIFPKFKRQGGYQKRLPYLEIKKSTLTGRLFCCLFMIFYPIRQNAQLYHGTFV